LTRLIALFIGVLAVTSVANAATVAPHRAVYDLILSRAGNGSALTSAQGRLAFEIQGSACEGWTVSFRMATRYQPSDAEGSLIDTQSTSFEAGDGLDFRYQIRELINGKVKKDERISVTRPSPQDAATGQIHAKEDQDFTVPAAAVLPMQHQLRLMALGEAGGGRDSSVVYDGSDGEKTFRAISFVGKTKPAGSISRDLANPEAAPLTGLAAWPMTISYFPETGGEAVPDYQVTFDMYENGVATGVLLDYGTFALSGTLAKLEMLSPSPCP
jgi:hypothetical protein